MNGSRVAWGLGLMALALLPTPDDVTIISPIIQFVGGAFLVTSGVIEKDKK